MPIKALYEGESWTGHSVLIKGFDSFGNSSYSEDGTESIVALRASVVTVDETPSHFAAGAFLTDQDSFAANDAVVLDGNSRERATNRIFVCPILGWKSSDAFGRVGAQWRLEADRQPHDISRSSDQSGSPRHTGGRYAALEMPPSRLQRSDDLFEHPAGHPAGVVPAAVGHGHAVVASQDDLPFLRWRDGRRALRLTQFSSAITFHKQIAGDQDVEKSFSIHSAFGRRADNFCAGAGQDANLRKNVR